MAEDGDLHHQAAVAEALALYHDEVDEAAAGGGGPHALDMMLIDEAAAWLLDLLDPPLELHGVGDDAATPSSSSTITVESCIAGDEIMLPTEGADWDGWIVQDQDSAAAPRGGDGDGDAATATTAESWVKGDDLQHAGACDCVASSDLPLHWWVPEPTGPPEQPAEGGGVLLPDLEAAAEALFLYLIWEPDEH